VVRPLRDGEARGIGLKLRPPVDHYRVLGLRRDASQLAIKRAYRKLAKRHHPDRNPGDPSAEERFKEVSAAYEVLGDLERRWEYDRELFGLDRGTRADAVASDAGRPDGGGRGFPVGSLAWASGFEMLDGLLGCLLALSFAMAAAVRSAAPETAAVTLGALLIGWLWAGRRGPAAPFARSRFPHYALLVVLTSLGVLGSGLTTPTAPRVLAESSGWIPAVAGGMAGGLTGAGFGRIIREAAGSPAGALCALLIGGALGAGGGGFIWYWAAVFRWTHEPWPPDESLSLAALAGVIGSALGGALAALVGTMRAAAVPGSEEGPDDH
jgi:hypothetical protein